MIVAYHKARRIEFAAQVRGTFREFIEWARSQSLPAGVPEETERARWGECEADAWAHYNRWAEAGDAARLSAGNELKGGFWKFQQSHALVTSKGALKGESPLSSEMRKRLKEADVIDRIINYSAPPPGDLIRIALPD